MSTEGGTKAVLAAAAANSFIAVTKFGAWLLTGASSLLAEAIHSVADTGNQVLLLVGGKQAKREATPEHPFGYGRSRYLAAFLVSIILFSLGGLFALYEAWHKYQELGSGHVGESLLTSPWWWVPVVVLSLSIIAEGFSLRTALVEANRSRGSLSLMSYVRRAKSPELPVVLLEDIAAQLGLVFALAGVTLSLVTHDLIYDVIGTALIGVLLVLVAIFLGWETRSLLLGEAALPEHQQLIEAAILGTPGIERLIEAKTMHLGPEKILLTAKISLGAASSLAEVAATINAAEDRIRQAVPEVQFSYLEPDVYDPSREKP